eukprot:gene3164-3962_t
MKINTECICHLSPKKIRFIIQGDLEDGMQVWCELMADAFFENYLIESISNNEIQFQIQLELLRRVLQSGINSNDIVVRLVKKGNLPFLHFIIKNTTTTVVLFQDVPIVLLTAQQLAQITEPILPDPQVHILMPPLKNVQNVIEKMRNLSEALNIRVSMNNQLTLSVETSNGSISTFYKGLEHPHFEGRPKSDGPSELSATVTVDIKKFAKVLYVHQLAPDEVVCCLYEGRSLILHVILQDICLTYYLPVIIR